MILLASLLLALILHVLLGWPWSILGGVLAGLLAPKTGWMVGTFAVGFSWTLLVLYNFAVAPPETARFLVVTGGLLGNMSGTIVVVATILIGSLLGLLGGVIGSLLRRTADDVQGRRHP